MSIHRTAFLSLLGTAILTFPAHPAEQAVALGAAQAARRRRAGRDRLVQSVLEPDSALALR